MATITAVESHPRHVQVRWSDGHSSTFHHVWLRDNCPQKRHPQTNHRVDETSAIPLDIAPTMVQLVDGALQEAPPGAKALGKALDKAFEPRRALRPQRPRPQPRSAPDIFQVFRRRESPGIMGGENQPLGSALCPIVPIKRSSAANPA
jgi:hypothetical protein